MKLATIIALTVAIALVPEVATAKQTRKHYVTRTAQPAHIACTKYGCHPIPPGCTPTTQYDFFGNPTGYDRIACR